MNRELADIVKIYSTGTHEELHSCLLGKSKDTLISILVDLLTMYINDKNSSTIREFLAVTLAGYEHKGGKIGYNGFKQDVFTPGKTITCEAKPKNVDTNLKPLRKLNGGGNFTDYTYARFERDKQKDSLNMLISGFVDGKLIYIIEFPFICPSFLKKLEMQLLRWEARLIDGRGTTGQFLRSASFDYNDFINCPDLKIVYLLNRNKLEKYKPYIVKNFYEFLEGKTE